MQLLILCFFNAWFVLNLLLIWFSAWEGFLPLSTDCVAARTARCLTRTDSRSDLQQRAKPFWNTEKRQLVDNFTCSPPVSNLAQLCWDLGVARSGREPRYFPSELYLEQKEQVVDFYIVGNDNNDDHLHLSTFPWTVQFPELPPIMTKPPWKATAHLPSPPFARVSCVPP